MYHYGMARGVGWGDRKDGYWLASNGRWYEARHRPKRWDRTALPPAPYDPADVKSSGMSTSSSSGAPAVSPPAPPPATAPSASPPAPKAPTSRIVRSRAPGRVADADVIDQRDHHRRIDSGAAPAAALSAGGDEGAVEQVEAPTTPPAPSQPANDALEVVAGDLGRVFGAAKRRLEQAVNDAVDDR